MTCNQKLFLYVLNTCPFIDSCVFYIGIRTTLNLLSTIRCQNRLWSMKNKFIMQSNNDKETHQIMHFGAKKLHCNYNVQVSKQTINSKLIYIFFRHFANQKN